MKRLVWLLLLAFSTAIAQVQPVDVRLVPEDKCDCCEQDGGCGMPDCGQPPVTTHSVLQLSEPVPVVRAVAKRAAPAPQATREKFYVRFLPRVSKVTVHPTPATAVSPASVPLFKEHCSFLI